MTVIFWLKTLLVILNLALLAPAALGLTLCLRPRRVSAWVAGAILSVMSIVIVVSEIAGRISYTPLGLTLGMTAAAVIGLALIHFQRRRVIWPQWPPLSTSRTMKFLAAIILAVWGFAALWMFAGHVLIPPSAPDALIYHLTGPAFWVDQGHIGKTPGANLRINYFPHAMSILWGWTLALTHGDFLGGTFPVLTVFVLWPTVCYMIATYCGAARDVALTCSVISGATSIILMQGMNEGVDVLFWAAALMAVYIAVAGTRDFGRHGLAAGLAAGLALGVKSYGLVAAALALSLWLVIALYQARRRNTAYAPVLAMGFAAGLIALSIGGWVYVENLLSYGNPVFPYPFLIDLEPGRSLAQSFREHGTVATSAGPLAALGAILSLTPALLMGLAPLDAKLGAYSTGFGYISAVMTFMAAGLTAYAFIQRRTSGGPLTRARLGVWAGIFGAAFIINAILASQWGVQLLQARGPDYSSVGRYQLFWPALTATLVAMLLPAAQKWRNALMAILAGVFIAMTVYTLLHGSNRNWKTMARLTPMFPDRLAQSAYVNPRMTPKLADWLQRNPEANILEFSRRSLIYPLFYPDFKRYVHTRPSFSTNRVNLENWDFDPTINDVLQSHDWVSARTCQRRALANLDYIDSLPPRMMMRIFNNQIVFEENITLILTRPSARPTQRQLENDPNYIAMGALEDTGAGATYWFRPRGDIAALYGPFRTCLQDLHPRSSGRTDTGLTH